MFFITAIHFYGLDSRCFGYFQTLAEAKLAVENNLGNLEENYYDFCVIEEIGPNIHPEVKSEVWYKWAGNSWELIDKKELPEEMFDTNYSLG